MYISLGTEDGIDSVLTLLLFERFLLFKLPHALMIILQFTQEHWRFMFSQI